MHAVSINQIADILHYNDNTNSDTRLVCSQQSAQDINIMMRFST